MKLVRSIAFSCLVGVGSFSAVACGGTVEQPQTTAQAATKAPIGQSTHGLVKTIGDALGEVPLRAEQRTEIEKMALDAEARHTPMAQAHKDLMLALADQVEAGAIDRSALQPKIDKIAADMEKARTEDRAAFQRLHDILDKDQRNAFVDAFEAQMKAKHGARGPHGPHGQGMKGPGPGGPEHAMGGFLQMKQFADDLKLTDEQRTKIHEVMREQFREGMKMHHADRAAPATGDAPTDAPSEAKKEHHRGGWKGPGGHHGPPGAGHHQGKVALEAFREDKLDLDKVAPPHDLKKMASFGVDHMSGMAEKILPILTPEQRKLAADKVRTMVQKGELHVQ